MPFLSFTYDDKGIRTSKTYGDTTTYYTNIDGNVTAQYQLDENGNIINLAEFIYDSSDNVIGFTYEGETYFYLKNLQNDVLAVIDSNGELMAKYDYSTWGWHTGWSNDDVDADIYNVNPFRYRSYIYDEEMSMCYLQSRYYITTFGRFLNSDLPEYAKLQKNEHTGLNLFAYCNNDPVNKTDPCGTLAANILSGVVGAIISVLAEILVEAIIHYFKNYGSFRGFKLATKKLAVAAIQGLASGVLLSSRYKKIVQAVGSGIIGAFGTVLNNYKSSNFKSLVKEAIIDFAFCAALGFLCGDGVGSSFWKGEFKSFLGKGQYVFKGVVLKSGKKTILITSSLKLTKPVLREFSIAFKNYAAATLANCFYNVKKVLH